MRKFDEVEKDLKRHRRTDRDAYAATNRLTVELLLDIREHLAALVDTCQLTSTPPKP